LYVKVRGSGKESSNSLFEEPFLLMTADWSGGSGIPDQIIRLQCSACAQQQRRSFDRGQVTPSHDAHRQTEPRLLAIIPQSHILTHA
jgi:hypothetical protein